jgi:4-aminobutyrate--pyruvate transaminase
VALKTLEIYERDKTFEYVASISDYFQARVNKLNTFESVGEARGVGLICGIELVSDKASKAGFTPMGSAGRVVAKTCQDEGLIVRAIGDVIAMCPPLIITTSQIDEMFDIFELALLKAESKIL